MKKLKFLLIALMLTVSTGHLFAQDSVIHSSGPPVVVSATDIDTQHMVDSLVQAKIQSTLNGTSTGFILPSMTGSQMATDIYIFIGFFIYMFCQWRHKKLRDPSISWSLQTWTKQNWYNTLLFTAGVFFIFNKVGSMNTWAALNVGISANLIIDLVGAFVEKMIVGKVKYEDS
jgi:hypothetical protein